MARTMTRMLERGIVFVVVLAVALIASTPVRAASGLWRVVPTPNPGGNQIANISFLGVSASSPTDAWAVGIDEVLASRRPLAEHWDGSRWTAVVVPHPAGRQAWFRGVLALADDDVWAVGESSNSDSTNEGERTLVEHFDGSAWIVVPSPNPAHGLRSANLLTSISATGPTDIWAAGWDLDPSTDAIQFLLEHWDGTSWSVSPPPPGGLDSAWGIAAIAPDDVWAVGDSALQTTRAAHWDGSTWTIVPTPSLHDGVNPTNILTGVTAISSDDVWASGYEGNVDNQNFSQPYMLHWDGSAWRLTTLPNQGGEGSSLYGTISPSSTDVWAVGQTQELDGSILTLTERFDGTNWSIVPSPNPGHIQGIRINGLRGVAWAGGTSLFAMGFQEFDGACCTRTLGLQTNRG
jgi:hypothetical protein